MLANINKKQGSIIQWNDERGFGFIKEEGKPKKIFCHISKINMHSSHKPAKGVKVIFEIKHNHDKNRISAYNVSIQGVPAHKVTPKRTTLLDYFYNSDYSFIWIYWNCLLIRSNILS